MVLMLLGGCFHQVPVGEITTPGITIKAEDNSFTLVSGREFTTPFHAKRCGQAYTGRDLTEAFPDFIDIGAKRVIVKNPYTKKPLYGVMVFCSLVDNIFNDTYGPGTRSYEVIVPQKNIEQAKGHKISVVYETVPERGGKYEWLSWVLWLSEKDFATAFKN